MQSLPSSPAASSDASRDFVARWFGNDEQARLTFAGRIAKRLGDLPPPASPAVATFRSAVFPMLRAASPRLKAASELDCVREAAEAILPCDDPGDDEAWEATQHAIAASLVYERLLVAWALEFSEPALAALRAFPLARPWARRDELVEEMDLVDSYGSVFPGPNYTQRQRARRIVDIYSALGIDVLCALRSQGNASNQTSDATTALIASQMSDADVARCKAFLKNPAAVGCAPKLRHLHEFWRDLSTSPLLGVAVGSSRGAQ